MSTLGSDYAKKIREDARLTILKALAEQNQSLVQRCELNRRRTLGLGVVVLLLLAALIFIAR